LQMVNVCICLERSALPKFLQYIYNNTSALLK
jgi:hypothetical protein